MKLAWRKGAIAHFGLHVAPPVVGGYGYACGEKKKGGEGRNVAESLFLPLDGFVEPGFNQKNSD